MDMTTTQNKVQIRATSTNGLATYFDTTAKSADKEAHEISLRSTYIEADILVGGEFRTAYINGVRVLA